MKTIQYERVGDILKLERRTVTVDPLATYKEIGVRSFGRGIFHKEPVTGAELGSKRVFTIEPEDLILNNVFAWEGAISVATQSEKGMIGSHRFMTYVPKTGEVNTSYLRYFFLSEVGLSLIQRASPGSAGRNRTLGIDAFEALAIPMPSLPQQEEIAQRIERVIEGSRTLSSTLSKAAKLRNHLVDASIREIVARGVASGWPLRRLDDVAMINPSPARLSPEGVVTFVPMSAVDDISGRIKAPERRAVGDLKSGYKQFRAGDVIFARITPCMQNGKSAVAVKMPSKFAYGSTEFHVIRPGDEVLADWIHCIVRTKDFQDKAAERFTGTAGQQRVPADFMRQVEVPVPRTLEEQSAVLVRVNRLVELGEHVRSVQVKQMARSEALIPSVLNAEFATLT